jgi:hypothetical protein
MTNTKNLVKLTSNLGIEISISRISYYRYLLFIEERIKKHKQKYDGKNAIRYGFLYSDTCISSSNIHLARYLSSILDKMSQEELIIQITQHHDTYIIINSNIERRRKLNLLTK